MNRNDILFTFRFVLATRRHVVMACELELSNPVEEEASKDSTAPCSRVERDVGN